MKRLIVVLLMVLSVAACKKPELIDPVDQQVEVQIPGITTNPSYGTQPGFNLLSAALLQDHTSDKWAVGISSNKRYPSDLVATVIWSTPSKNYMQDVKLPAGRDFIFIRSSYVLVAATITNFKISSVKYADPSIHFSY